jgi:glycogen(starch) synthase
MNICLVSQEYPPATVRGGIGVQTWNKARALARLGHNVHVLACAAGLGPDPSTTNDKGVTVHRLQPPGSDFPVYQTPTYWLGYTWAVLRHLHGLMQTTAFDVFDFPEYGAEGFAYQLDRTPWNWVPVVVQFHGGLAMFAEQIGWPDKASPFYRTGRFMEEFSIRQADGLMACSGAIADFTARFYRVSRKLVDVIHVGIDVGRFRPPRNPIRGRGRPTVLFVGNIVGNKGVELVFQAVRRLRRKHRGLRLRLAGKLDDDLAGELQVQARKDGLAGAVEFLGFVDQAKLPRLYQQADVFCGPSQYEAFGIVYVEALACGCPVVACKAGGAVEAVRDGETGLLVPPDDAAAVTAALDRLLGDAALRRRMGAAGRRAVEGYFAADRYAERVLKTYAKAIERSRHKLARHKARE